MSEIEIWCDGSCEPINPGGNAGCGVVIHVDGNNFEKISKYVGSGPLMSCNVAEYQAVIHALKFCLEKGWEKEDITIISDSQLIINQMLGKFKVKGGLYVIHYLHARNLRDKFSNLKFRWVPREQNIEADFLSKNYARN